MSSEAASGRLIIATRESPLALWQARHVRELLAALYPGLEIDLLGLTTQGDRILESPLAKIGGKGLFVKELEVAMQEGRADLAVHSMKDVPMVLPEGFALAAIVAREDARDAFVSNDYADFSALPAGAVVGTSSLRRQVQIRARYPHLRVETLRGNVQTRLAKLDRGEYAAIVLAAAGLKRLGLDARIRRLLEVHESLPAVGQGALGIECRADRPQLMSWLAALNDPVTAACVRAERACGRRLGGSCQTPLGAYATWSAGRLDLRAFIADPEGGPLIGAEASSTDTEAEALGIAVAEDLLARGGRRILARLGVEPHP